jgi:hypothetical protein
MEAALIVKKLLVIAVWVTIGFAFIPLAKERGRSWLLWFVLGLAAFYIPFLSLQFIPLIVTLLVVKGSENAASTMGMVVMIALPIGLSAGIYCARKLRKHLASH